MGPRVSVYDEEVKNALHARILEEQTRLQSPEFSGCEYHDDGACGIIRQQSCRWWHLQLDAGSWGIVAAAASAEALTVFVDTAVLVAC